MEGKLARQSFLILVSILSLSCEAWLLERAIQLMIGVVSNISECTLVHKKTSALIFFGMVGTFCFCFGFRCESCFPLSIGLDLHNSIVAFWLLAYF